MSFKFSVVFFLAIANFLLLIPSLKAAEDSKIDRSIPKIDDYFKKAPTIPKKAPELKKKEEEAPAKKPATEIKIKINKIIFEGNTVFTSDELQEVVKDLLLNKEISFNDLQDGLRTLSNFYQRKGVWARAIAPEQDFSKGTITISIIESHLGKVVVRYADKDGSNLKENLTQKFIENKLDKGTILDTKQIERNIRNLNNLPGVKAIGSLEAGTNDNETDIVIDIEKLSQPWIISQTDNMGSRQTGFMKQSTLLNYDGLLPWGSSLSLQQVHSIHTDFLALDNSFPIGADGTKANIRFGNLKYDLGSPFTTNVEGLSGYSTEGSVILSKPLGSLVGINVASNLGFHKTHYENNVKSLNTHLTTNNSKKDIEKVNPEISLDYLDSFLFGTGGLTTAKFTYTFGKLDLSKNKSYQTTDLQNAQTNGGYEKRNFTLSRLQAINEDNTIQISYDRQLASKNLDGAEKLSLGGAYGVRAWPSSEAQGDEGYIASINYKHTLSNISILNPKDLKAGAFYDYGKIRLHKKPWDNWNTLWNGVSPDTYGYPSLYPGNDYYLKGFGLTLDWDINPAMKLNTVYAQTLGSNPGRDPTDGSNNDALHVKRQLWANFNFSF